MVLDAMSTLELQSIQHPMGAGGFLDMAVSQALQNVQRPRALASAAEDAWQLVGHFVMDLSMGANDFVCSTTFVRGVGLGAVKSPLCAEFGEHCEAYLEAQVIADTMNSWMKKFPNYREKFDITPGAGGQYTVTIIPGMEGMTPWQQTVYLADAPKSATAP